MTLEHCCRVVWCTVYHGDTVRDSGIQPPCHWCDAHVYDGVQPGPLVAL